MAGNQEEPGSPIIDDIDENLVWEEDERGSYRLMDANSDCISY